ncbi:MAG TPA: hypothetical protein VHC21_00940 [Candidatus Saccharimonadales bacterium]|nr:hypothetical protein [Candidatus Saccharimonadales bacterium]
MMSAKNEKSTFYKIFFYFPLILGGIFILTLIAHYGVNTPFWDQWDMVALFQKASHHSLGFADLWHQHNEHRIFFPLLVLLANAYLTHWNTFIEMFISAFFALVTAVLLFSLIKRSIQTYWLGICAALIVSVWFFSPVQWQNWLWGGQVAWFMTNLGAIAALFLITKGADAKTERTRHLLFLFAGLTAFISTFSLASGLFSWIAGLILLILNKEKKKILEIWSLAGLISIGLYYYHLSQTPTPSGSASQFFIHHPLGFIKFFIALLGGPVGSFSGGGLQTALPGSLQLPLVVGGILLAALVPVAVLIWYRRNNIRAYAPWLALIIYSLLCILSTAYGRLGYGIDLVYKSRYTAFSLLYVIGLVVLAIMLLNESRLKKYAKVVWVGSLMALMLPIMISSYAVGFHGFSSQSQLLKQTKACTHANPPTQDCLFQTYPKPWIVSPRLEYVKDRHWAGY